jgi:hypothetical protein
LFAGWNEFERTAGDVVLPAGLPVIFSWGVLFKLTLAPQTVSLISKC